MTHDTSTALQQTAVEGLLVAALGERPLVGARLPVSVLTRSQKAAELQRVQRARAMCAAYEAELVMGLADDPPDTLDPPPGHPGARRGSWAPDDELPGVSEFFPAELAVVLNCGRGTASHLAARAFTFRESLPATRAALAAGALDEPRAKVLAEVLDHVVPHSCGGETDCANLCCLCRSRHRLKTLARGWRFVLTDDGDLQVTTPSGIPRTTRPPGLRPPAAEPRPADESPPQSRPPVEDPPPF